MWRSSETGRRRRFAFALILCSIALALPRGAGAQEHSIAKVRKKNGQVVEGVIPGALLFKGAARDATEGGKTIHTVAYEFLPGSQVEAVDAAGVRSRGGVFLLYVAASEGALPGDLELASEVRKVVRDVMKISGLGFSTHPLRNGALLVLNAVDPARETPADKVDFALRISRDFHGPIAAAATSRIFELERELAARYREEAQAAGGTTLTFRDRLLGEYRFEKEKDQILPSLVVETTRGPVTVPLTAIGGTKPRR